MEFVQITDLSCQMQSSSAIFNRRIDDLIIGQLFNAIDIS